ncbi:MAG: DUF4402 domain-containing protein [Parerythrobacter sp.]
MTIVRQGAAASFPVYALAVAAGGLLCMATPATAKQAELRVDAQTELRFGSFAVLDQGYRAVGPNGSVQELGIYAVTRGDTGPARFTVSYDRGNNGRKQLDIEIELVFATPAPFLDTGLKAQLGQYRTDLPGYASVSPGQVVTLRIPGCRQRVCSTTFNVGGRLDVSRSTGGGPVVINIPVDAVLISIR